MVELKDDSCKFYVSFMNVTWYVKRSLSAFTGQLMPQLEKGYPRINLFANGTGLYPKFLNMHSKTPGEQVDIVNSVLKELTCLVPIKYDCSLREFFEVNERLGESGPVRA